ncbi:MAG TPA: TadE/TadG family type IV pilus assembly protein [Acidothermaceae bacterium]
MRRLVGRRWSSCAHARVQRRDSGAAAVEFALVLPILLLIVFGIIDYGLYFGNSLDTRSGVATVTRQAVVNNFDTTCPVPVGFALGSDSGYLACMVEARTDPLGGTTFVKVILPTDPASNKTGWYEGESVVVCEATVAVGVTGYVPLPTNGVIRVRLVSQIEQHPMDATQPDVGGSDATPPGGWDSWCTAAS